MPLLGIPFAALLCLVALLALGTLQVKAAMAAANEVGPGAESCAAVAEQAATRLEGMRQEGNVPAMGLALFCDGRPLLVVGFGTADADTPFRWGSITKSITGLAALTLIATTDLTLASPIRPILGEGYYHNPWADTDPVRVGHLLSLSAGMPDLNRAEWNDNEPRPLWQALTRYQDQRQLLWPAGLQHSYSNVPPGLTAAVIERVSGQPLDTYLARRLFEPLEMPGASLDPVPGLPGGFKADGGTPIPYWHMTFRAFGALNASTGEMSRLLTALLNQGRLNGGQALPADLVAAFFEPQGSLAAEAGLPVGYGSGVYGWVRGGQLFHGHGGDADGYRSRYGLLREHGRGYLLVINTDNPRLLGRMRRVAEDALTRNLPARQPARIDPGSDALESLTGRYYPASVRFYRDDWQDGRRQAAEVRRAGSTLLLERDGQTTTLYPVGGGQFFREGDPEPTIIFVRGTDGVLYLQGEAGNFARTSPGPCPDFLRFCE